MMAGPSLVLFLICLILQFCPWYFAFQFCACEETKQPVNKTPESVVLWPLVSREFYFSPRRPVFEARSVRMGFVVKNVTFSMSSYVVRRIRGGQGRFNPSALLTSPPLPSPNQKDVTEPASLTATPLACCIRPWLNTLAVTHSSFGLSFVPCVRGPSGL